MSTGLTDKGDTQSPVSLLALRETCTPLLSGLPGGALIVFDEQMRVLLAEGEGFALANLRAETLVGRVLSDVLPADAWATLRGPYSGALAGRSERLELVTEGVWFSVQVSPCLTTDGVCGGMAVAHEVTERRRLEGVAAEQERAARASEDLLRSAFDHAPIGISVLAPDGKWLRVNDEYCRMFGYERTDLMDMSFRDLTHPEDVVADDEFMAAAASGERDRLERDKRYIRRDGTITWVHLRSEAIRAPGGDVRYFVSHLLDVNERRAEETLRTERLDCAALISSALAQERLVLHGQPIVDLATMRIEQAELLVRMRRDRVGQELIPPGEFLPGAERFGLIEQIDEWVIARAIEHAARGHRIEVNVSAQTISEPAQVAWIEREIIASGAPPENLVFEITETAVASNLEAARVFATRLRALGCSFALDDFGVGHGTFTYLRHLPVDYLKIDMQFVRDLLTDEADRNVVEAIISVAGLFEIKTIAEGVENQATLDELRRMGADYAQGYWIGRPGPLTKLWKTQKQSRRRT